MPKSPSYKWDASITIAAAIVSRADYINKRTTGELPEVYKEAAKKAWDMADALEAEEMLRNP